MKLGDGIQARRTRATARAARRKGGGDGAPERRPSGFRFAGWLFALTAGGLLVGYVVATRANIQGFQFNPDTVSKYWLVSKS